MIVIKRSIKTIGKIKRELQISINRNKRIVQKISRKSLRKRLIS